MHDPHTRLETVASLGFRWTHRPQAIPTEVMTKIFIAGSRQISRQTRVAVRPMLGVATRTEKMRKRLALYERDDPYGQIMPLSRRDEPSTTHALRFVQDRK
jgi:hypothetical protein